MYLNLIMYYVDLSTKKKSIFFTELQIDIKILADEFFI